MSTDPETLARAIVDENLYMVLATSDGDGHPWASPVYFAPAQYRDLFWVSDPNTRHSRNIAGRAEVGIVIFDSRQPIGTGKAVYADGRAEKVARDGLELGVEVFSRRSLAHGGSPWTPGMVQAPERLRLYRATVVALYVVDGDDRRVRVDP